MEYHSLQTAGSEYYPKEDFWRLSGIVSRGEKTGYGLSQQNLYTGFSNGRYHTTLQLGSDIFSKVFLFETGEKTFIGIRPYLGTSSSFLFNSEAGEEISTLQLRLGIDLQYLFLDASNGPTPEGLTPYDLSWYLFANFHRFARDYAMGKSLTRPSNQSQEYTQELFGEEEGLPSDMVEDAGFFNSVALYGAGNEDGGELRLQLKANDDQAGWIAAGKIATGAGYFAIHAPTQGFGAGLELLHWSMGRGFDLDLATRRTLPSKAKKEKARNFLLARAAVNALALGIGWASQSDKTGRGLLQGAQQAMTAATLNPDPAETRLAEEGSYHFVYEATKQSGNYVGYEQTTSLSSSHLYTGARFLVQTVPGSDYAQDEWIDDATGRNPLYEGAKAKASASLGLELKVGPLVLRAGGLTALHYGKGARPVPAVGLEQQASLNFELHKRVDLELGIGATESLVQGKTELSVTPFLGARVAFF